MNSPTTVLSLDHVTLDMGHTRVLDDLSIVFWAGHVHAVIGPNGAGKSTMAHVIMGLSGYRDFAGDVVFEGESLKGLAIDKRARRGISLAWQEPARFEGLSVREFIGAAAKDQREARVRDVLDQVGLNPDVYADRAVDKTLSGGERKRIELAAILAMQPKLVLMDEPDSGIDVEVTGEARSVSEVTARVAGSGDDRIAIKESAHLVGQSARGVLTSNIALRDRARAEVLNTLTASAPYARGHVDCKEIVQDEGVAKAVPVVEVRHPKAHVTHEAAIGSVDSKQLETLMSRGLDEDQAVDLIIQGLLRQ